MIGTRILSPHHLTKLIPTNTPCNVILQFTRGHQLGMGVALCLENSERYKNTLLIFNNGVSSHTFSYKDIDIEGNYENITLCHQLSTHYAGVATALYNDTHFHQEIKGITLLPSNFNELWESFIQSNKQAYNKAVEKYGFSSGSIDIAKIIFSFTGDSKNFFFWAVDMFFRNRINMPTIRKIMLWNEQYGQLVSKLSKNTITAYNSRDKIFLLNIETQDLRREKRINDVINSFNTSQKKALKAVDKTKLTKQDKDAFSKFASLSLAKRTNFIRKMSTIDDAETILKHLRHVTNVLFDWNKTSLLDFISNGDNINATIVKDEGDIVLLRVTDYNTIKKLAKHTNWCISKNKSYWNNYVEYKQNATQYMLFNFGLKEDDLYSIIGFTSIANTGITNAHNFINENLMGEQFKHNKRKSYFARFNMQDNIFGILANLGIDLSLVTEITPYRFKWSKQDFLSYLYLIVNRNNVQVLSDFDNKICLSVRDSNIRYLLGDRYMDEHSEDTASNQHILFLDFNLPAASPHAFIYSLILNDERTNECFACETYNPKCRNYTISFNKLLEEYHLPYDTIRRIDDAYGRFKDMMSSDEIELNVNAETTQFLLKYGKENAIDLFDLIHRDVLNNLTFDTVNWIYNNGLKLVDVIGEEYTSNLVIDILCHYKQWASNIHKDDTIPTQKDIDNFWNEYIKTQSEVGYVGYYIMLCLLIENEKSDRIIKDVIQRLSKRKKIDVLAKDILYRLSDIINFSSDDMILSYYIPAVYKYNCTDIIAKLETLPTLSEFGKKAMELHKQDFAYSAQ